MLSIRRLKPIVLRDWTNFSLARQRNRQLQGFIATQHSSGTHWLKHMLTVLLVRQHDLTMPEHMGDHSVVGTPKVRPTHTHIPQLIHGHAVPSPLVHAPPLGRALRFPPYVLLVRDIRAVLVSRYEKHKVDFPGCAFADFLRGDPDGRRYGTDLWWEIRFLNTWNRIHRWHPGLVHVLHYEHLRQDTLNQLRGVCSHLGLGPFDDTQLQQAIEASDKSRMAKREEPNQKYKVVRQSKRDPVEWYTNEDRQFFNWAVTKYLANDFGYDYNNWQTASGPPCRPADRV